MWAGGALIGKKIWAWMGLGRAAGEQTNKRTCGSPHPLTSTWAPWFYDARPSTAHRTCLLHDKHVHLTPLFFCSLVLTISVSFFLHTCKSNAPLYCTSPTVPLPPPRSVCGITICAPQLHGASEGAFIYRRECLFD
jgi:hypothetical protein